MNRRNFFRALSALAALPLAKLSPQQFANGGLVEAPTPAPLVGETVHEVVIDTRKLAETIEEVMREHRLLMSRSL